MYQNKDDFQNCVPVPGARRASVAREIAGFLQPGYKTRRMKCEAFLCPKKGDPMKKKQKVAVRAVRNRSAEIPALHIQNLLNAGEMILLNRR